MGNYIVENFYIKTVIHGMKIQLELLYIMVN